MDDVTGEHIRHHRAGEAQWVDAEVAVEAAVFDGDDGFRDVGWELLDVDDEARDVAIAGDDRAIFGADGDGGAAGEGGFIDQARKFAAEVSHDGDDRNRSPDGEEREKADYGRFTTFRHGAIMRAMTLILKLPAKKISAKPRPQCRQLCAQSLRRAVDGMLWLKGQSTATVGMPAAIAASSWAGLSSNKTSPCSSFTRGALMALTWRGMIDRNRAR